MRVLRERTVYSGWGKFLVLDVGLASGKTVQRQIDDHGNAVAVLPYDPDRRTMLLVRQLRVGPLYSGAEPYLLEVAAGMIDSGEQPDLAAAREASEELGVRLNALTQVAAVWSTPAVSSERIHLFLAEYRAEDRIDSGGGIMSEGEEIEVLELPVRTVLEWADSGELLDMKTLALVWALWRREPELFT